MEELKKQGVVWKPYNHNSLTWVFFKVNDNQLVNMNVNQII